MNALNLKITGDTKRKGKKKELPEDVSLFYEENGSCKTVLDMLSNACTLEAQIAFLKSDLLSIDHNRPDVGEVIVLLLNMVYVMNLKSPLRTAILKHISSVEGVQSFVIQSHLVQFVSEQITREDIDSFGRVLNFLPLWIENSSGCCHLPFEIIENQVIPYLERMLDKLQIDLSCDMPPMTKLRVLEILHSNIRCLLTVFQKFPSCPSSKLVDVVLSFLKNDQFPLDTRANCGIFFALSYKARATDFQSFKLDEIIDSRTDSQAMLCVCGGFLRTLEYENISVNVPFEGETISLLEYFIRKIISVEENDPADCAVVLSASRCILAGTKCLAGYPNMLTKHMLTSLLNFIWNHLEHYMDAVRHLASSSLTNIVSAGKRLEERFVFEAISTDIEAMASERRSKHAAISALIGNLPIQNLLDKSPGLVNALLESAKFSPSVNHAIGSFEALMIQHYQELSSFEEWYTLWVDPVIKIFGDRPNAALEHILGAMMKTNPEVVLHISRLEKSENVDLTTILLICLRIGKKLGVLKFDKDAGNLNGLFDYEMLSKNVYHLSGEIRIACFALITETQKLSEEFTANELEITKLFLKYNISNHCASERQRTLAYFKKFMTRLKLLLDQCTRQIAKENAPICAAKERFELYSGFIAWLRQFCIDNLFPGANFARRCTALNLLTLCREMGLWDGCNQSEANCAVLMHCFRDSYEENIILAKKLLMEMPVEVLRFNVSMASHDSPILVLSFHLGFRSAAEFDLHYNQDSSYVKLYLDSAIRLASSVRPIDSQSAAYYVGLLAAFPSAGALLRSPYDSSNMSIPDPARYECSVAVLAKLKSELNVAKLSLLRAASTGPLYGQLFIIRNILKEANLSKLVDSQEWKVLVQEIITVAYNCNDTVACIVNSSSPEGHLPMDFDYDVKGLGSHEDAPNVTAQMVLLSSWRTVKEVSLLLGELSETSPISTDDEPGLVSEQQILEIGEHLSNLLAETKHRGAFEQAYVGFCKLASRLWRYPKGNLHELPGRWLAETLEEISSNRQLSATRRSAGIPFRIQGLVCTELEVGRGKCFHQGIATLLKLAGDPENSVETKCHALNILRALYRHTLLGEMVSPYVSEGLTIAIQGFNASSWAERNSSTLLLSALMTRVFGVPRSRSETLCWKNKMTGRIFFQRYPSLFSVLLQHLELASQKSLYPATYPALLVLGRLYPSSLEGTDSNLQLNKFIPLVFKCSGSHVLKTRSLAASAMVALITPNLFISHIEEIFRTLQNSSRENFTHGLLLQVLELFRSSTLLPEDVISSLNSKIPVWTEKLADLLKLKCSFVTKTTCVSILLHWVTNFFQKIPSNSLQDLTALLVEEVQKNTDKDSHFGASTFCLYSATLVLTIFNYQRRDSEIIQCVNIFLKHPNYDVNNVTLDFIRSVLKIDCNDELKKNVSTSEELAATVLARFEANRHHEDNVELLNVIRHLPIVFQLLESRKLSIVQYFGETIDRKPESLGSPAFKCITSFLALKDSSYRLESSDVSQLCRIIDMYSRPSCENSCRNAVAEFLQSSFDWLLKIGSPQDQLIIWTSALRLLNDDDCDIRESLSSYFCPNVASCFALEKFFDRLDNAELDAHVKCCLLIGWSLWDCNLEDLDGEDGSDCVFDKGDMNTYLEEITIAQHAVQRVASLLAARPESRAAQLPDYCSLWLSSFTHLNLTGSNIAEFESKIARLNSSRSNQLPLFNKEVSYLLLEKKLNLVSLFVS